LQDNGGAHPRAWTP